MTAQGMSAGTAKTAKRVEGEARQPGGEAMRPMTGFLSTLTQVGLPVLYAIAAVNAAALMMWS